jgi:hypothetical protein
VFASRSPKRKADAPCPPLYALSFHKWVPAYKLPVTNYPNSRLHDSLVASSGHCEGAVAVQGLCCAVIATEGPIKSNNRFVRAGPEAPVTAHQTRLLWSRPGAQPQPCPNSHPGNPRRHLIPPPSPVSVHPKCIPNREGNKMDALTPPPRNTGANNPPFVILSIPQLQPIRSAHPPDSSTHLRKHVEMIRPKKPPHRPAVDLPMSHIASAPGNFSRSSSPNRTVRRQ